MTVQTLSVTPVLARLRAETRPEHDAIETALELMSDTLTVAGYRCTLERFHGFYRPLEAGLRAVGGLDLTERRKTPLLEADLRALGVTDVANLPICLDLPPYATAAQAFGCLYVLEGATLGGQLISQSIHRTIGVTPETGGRFFRGYGDRTAAMWKAFRAALSGFAAAPDDQDQIVSAAKDTFMKLHRWIAAGANNR